MASSLWQRCVDELKYHVPDNIFTMWIRPLSAVEQQDMLVIMVPNQYFATYIEKNHLAQIQSVVSQIEPTRAIEVQIQIDKAPTLLKDVGSSTTGYPVAGVEGSAKADRASSFQYLDPSFTFDQFVMGKSNQIAYSICKETAQTLGESKNNPLFLYGSTGLGKTHLMQAVAHEILKQGKSFYYFTSDKFVNQLVYSIKQNKIDDFKDKIKKADLLIIDDIHVIASKPKSSAEFLVLFNDFISKNKQVILASDRHPSALTEFDERTKSRFSWGVSVALESPELDTRIQILQKKSKSQGMSLPKDCAIFIAQHIVANVRELEGALNKVFAMSRLLNQPVHLELVQMALKDVVAIRVQAVSMDNIRKVVAEFYDVSVKDLMGKKRLRHIARPRQVAMMLARELTNHSFTDIGQSFGGRDHTTVMHACEKVQELCLTDAMFDKDFRTLKLMLQT
ncbi:MULTISPECIES: chromosomal replication initiator protein DnaA [unclassified Moraxella]|uniref:chromosomal replication initiator protein DnaA n=1 Tax=unclassified Moraxella TaxID=2685852 RepID=UPI003AF5498C